MAITFDVIGFTVRFRMNPKVEAVETLDVRPTTAELDTLFDAWMFGSVVRD